MDLPSFVFVWHFSSQWVTEVGVGQQQWSKKPTFSVYPFYIPYFAKINLRQLTLIIFLASLKERNPLRLPRFISFIQEAKNNIHVIIDAWQLHFESALKMVAAWSADIAVQNKWRVQWKKGIRDFWLKLSISKTAPNFACWFV